MLFRICKEAAYCPVGKDSVRKGRNMQDKYTQWIYEYRQGHGSFGRCKEATRAMSQEFPELTEVAGHIEDAVWGRRAHWWLVAPDKSVVDPTSDQFPALYAYEPFRPGGKVRVGKCMYCGEELWAAVDSLDVTPPVRTFCGTDCELLAIAAIEA